jgi:hypothetical protein
LVGLLVTADLKLPVALMQMSAMNNAPLVAEYKHPSPQALFSIKPLFFIRL